ncbi:hypothetical protein P171DRAFT_440266 [Karstenula rhodostoma CBS 690.94]|uniref:Uncharacterized protein n=1 Tax=Karstenula rhodostoma CBS 690.94 TaxID=1392251 RepID=A0A9P4PR85_9PLEO|nr:hypothetical protein P171DRAFT_440266 [Karstenula rhodostoma CBS 690.94]
MADSFMTSLPVRPKRALPTEDVGESAPDIVDASASDRDIAQPVTRKMKTIQAIQANWPDAWDGTVLPAARLVDREIAPRIHIDGRKALINEDDVELLPPEQWAKGFVDALKQLSDYTKGNRMTAMSRLSYAVSMRILAGTGDKQWDGSRERFTREALPKDITDLCKKMEEEQKKK